MRVWRTTYPRWWHFAVRHREALRLYGLGLAVELRKRKEPCVCPPGWEGRNYDCRRHFSVPGDRRPRSGRFKRPLKGSKRVGGSFKGVRKER